jgi:hypothetical protein
VSYDSNEQQDHNGNRREPYESLLKLVHERHEGTITPQVRRCKEMCTAMRPSPTDIAPSATMRRQMLTQSAGGVYPVLINFQVGLDAVNSLSLQFPAVYGTARQNL